MIKIKSIFAVIDPSTDKQYALQRAMRIARVTGAKIHAYLCLSPGIDSHDQEALERVERARYQPWLDKIVEGARSEGFDISCELDWSDDWRNALGAATIRAKSDFIVKLSHRRTAAKRLLMTTSDLALLKTARCPVQLVSSEVVSDLHRVLIAVDTKRQSEKDQKIIDSVVSYGKAVAATQENGELHVVYAYESQDNFQHVTDIAKRVGVETKFVHITSGDPEEAIVAVAGKINADIILIGLSTRGSLKNRIFGDRVERILNNLDHDILVVIPTEE